VFVTALIHLWDCSSVVGTVYNQGGQMGFADGHDGGKLEEWDFLC